jgi:hypothetical protein
VRVHRQKDCVEHRLPGIGQATSKGSLTETAKDFEDRESRAPLDASLAQCGDDVCKIQAGITTGSCGALSNQFDQSEVF